MLFPLAGSECEFKVQYVRFISAPSSILAVILDFIESPHYKQHNQRVTALAVDANSTGQILVL